VHLRTTASVAGADGNGVLLRAGAGAITFAAAIVAVGPHQLARAFANDVLTCDPRLARAVAHAAALTYEPIITVYLGYPRARALPPGIVRLDDTPGQWIFDRPDILARAGPGAPSLAQLCAVIISTHGPHEALDHRALAAATDAQLRRLDPAWPPLAWSQVIAEQRATYGCTPQADRPLAGAIAPRLHLAGDYTDAEFPATLEAAVRSGWVAAATVARELGAD
jgi:predicted NAD/FAD-dependent oxidoreductase